MPDASEQKYNYPNRRKKSSTSLVRGLIALTLGALAALTGFLLLRNSQTDISRNIRQDSIRTNIEQLGENLAQNAFDNSHVHLFHSIQGKTVGSIWFSVKKPTAIEYLTIIPQMEFISRLPSRMIIFGLAGDGTRVIVSDLKEIKEHIRRGETNFIVGGRENFSSYEIMIPEPNGDQYVTFAGMELSAPLSQEALVAILTWTALIFLVITSGVFVFFYPVKNALIGFLVHVRDNMFFFEKMEKNGQGTHVGFLRLQLAVLVVLFHAGLGGGSGPFAVFSFYILSGFIISRVLFDRYLNSSFGAVNFYVSRLFRLVPTYLVVYLATFFVSLILSRVLQLPSGTLSDPYMDLQTVDIKHEFFKGFLPTASVGNTPVLSFFSVFRWIPPYWTVAIEIVFYLIAPLIIYLFRKVGWWVPAIFLVLSAAYYVYCVGVTSHNYQVFLLYVYRNFFASLVFFAWGVFLFFVSQRSSVRLRWWIAQTFAVLFCLLLFLSNQVTWIPQQEALNFVIWQLICIVVLPIIILSGEIPKKLKKLENLSGEISYGIYVVHYPLIAFLATVSKAAGISWDGLARKTAFWGLCVVLSIVLGLVVHYFIDAPFRKLRGKLYLGRRGKIAS